MARIFASRPMTPDIRTDIRTIIDTFVSQLVAVVEADSALRMQQVVAAVFSGELSASPFAGSTRAPGGAKAPGRRRSKRLCPVPGCTGVAAPVFGMVCAKHKDMPKAKIAEYRAQRRASKARK
jgi:hypothetical protein